MSSDSTCRPVLVCFSHLRWNFVYQRPQHLLARAARHYSVYYIEEPLIEAIDTAHLTLTETPEGVRILTPHIPASERDIEDAEARLIEDFFQDLPRVKVLWFYTPAALAKAGSIAADVVVYDCMDELSAFRGASPRLVEQEKLLFAKADLVFTGGRSLYAAKKEKHPRVFLFPSSIDKNHFSKARGQEMAEPECQKAIPQPRIGFFGVVDERMDLALVEAMARLRPEWHFVILGPVVKIDPASLPQGSNLHWLGQKDYRDLPAYLAYWQAGFMPFALNEATRFISPTKTPEFLAAGLPVVSTPIADVVKPYGEKGLVKIADDAPSMISALEKTLDHDRQDWRRDVDEYLRTESWDNTWQEMQRRITEAGARADTKKRKDVIPFPESVAGPRVHATRYDWLIVGAGYAGSVMAERLANEANQKVLVIDRRPHIAGNAYDCYNEAGLLIHLYGPHIFHTNSAAVFSYLSRFTAWRHYEHRVLASVDGQLLPIPINLDTVNRLYGLKLTSAQMKTFLAKRAEPVEPVRTAEDVVVGQVGRELYEKFFRTYTRKQWGMDPSMLDKSVTARVPTRTSRDDRYFTDLYQAMPRDGYTAMFTRMLDHPNITVQCGTDYRDLPATLRYDRLVYTGPIDEYFDFCFGKLPYRSLRFEHVTLEQEWFQPVGVVNYPQDKEYTRVTEYKHLTGQQHPKTSLTYEYPQAEGDPYYPIPRPDNAALYREYQGLADRTPGVHFLGRLASYRYYNMDQVVAQALATFGRLMAGEGRETLSSPISAGARSATKP
ncbi:MAG TPA: UDP-galactopyranose mutase [Dongiaceae bacterium]|jgi:UDP-galactopyranose mutase|nr:UDP-galactopyranose mutase [Dongiaceae bacterium]